MPDQTHINVTIDFSGHLDNCMYDVRIPVHQPVKQLLVQIAGSLHLDINRDSLFAIKVPAKELLLTDDDCLAHYPVTNGDILLVL